MLKHNKPGFHPVKNIRYAFEGLAELFKHEVSMKIEVFFFIFFQLLILFIPISLGYKVILSLSLFIPVMAEIVNSAIERLVDLVTRDFHLLAKYAKDAGSALVLVSVILTILIWVFTLLFGLHLL